MSHENYSVEAERAGSPEPNIAQLDREIDLTCLWCGAILHDDVFDCPVLNDSEVLPGDGEQQNIIENTEIVAAQTEDLAHETNQVGPNEVSQSSQSDGMQTPVDTQLYPGQAVSRSNGATNAQPAQEVAQHLGHTSTSSEVARSTNVVDASAGIYSASASAAISKGKGRAGPDASQGPKPTIEIDLTSAASSDAGEKPEHDSEHTLQSVAGSSSNSVADGPLDFHPSANTAPQGFADPSAAKDWLDQLQAQLVKPDIKNDDYPDFDDASIMAKGGEFYQAIQQNLEGPLSTWDPIAVKPYYVNNQLTSTGKIDKMLKNDIAHRKLLANCIIAAKELHKIHSDGVPQSHIDAAAKTQKTKCPKADGYPIDLSLKCSERFVEAIGMVRRNKSIAKRLAEGSYLDLIRDPHGCYKQELNNIRSNAFKKLNKQSTEDGEGEDLDEGEEQEQAAAAPTKAKAGKKGGKKRAPRKKAAKSAVQDIISTHQSTAPMTAQGPVAPAPVSDMSAGHSMQGAKRKRNAEVDEDYEIVAERQVQHMYFNEQEFQRREELARARAAAPAGLIDPEITMSAPHAQPVVQAPAQRSIQNAPQNGPPQQQFKRKDSGTAFDVNEETTSTQQRDQEHVARREEYMSSRHDALARSSAEFQAAQGLPATRQHNAAGAVESDHLFEPQTPYFYQQGGATPIGNYHTHGQPISNPQPQQPEPAVPMGSFTAPSNNYPPMEPPYNSFYNPNQNHAQGEGYLRSAQPFAGYTSMQQTQRMRRDSQNRSQNDQDTQHSERVDFQWVTENPAAE